MRNSVGAVSQTICHVSNFFKCERIRMLFC